MSIAIVAGALANKPMNGGFAWVPLSYALGLRRLGFEVYLYEETPAGADRSYFFQVASDFGLEPLPRGAARDAELLLNISGHATEAGVVDGPRVSAYVDTDPGFTQVWHRAGLLDPTIARHDYHFSVGLNLGQEQCPVPDDGIRWRPLPPPVVLDEWPVVESTPRAGLRFTTVASWRSPSGMVSLEGGGYLPAKLHEFRAMVSLPSLVRDACFEIALDIDPADGPDRDRLLAAGWTLVDPRVAAGTPRSFRTYVATSGAEFSTVQGIYSAAKTGWISDRSVRYLASGRPVLVQDTAVANNIVGGEGFVTFCGLDDARAKAEAIAADYAAHARAARRLAETYFDSDRVLGDMLDQMGARA